MTEKEYRLEHFEENLGFAKGRRIFIYGYGANSIALIERFGNDYGFCGVIVQDSQLPEAKAVMHPLGMNVFSLESALQNGCDIVLIAAQMYAAEEIYQRINKTCRDAAVLLLDMYGTDLIRLHDSVDACVFLDLNGWIEKTDKYDFVSFELLDTVLVRDIFFSRRPSVRPVFAKLVPMLKGKGTKVIFTASDEFAEDWYLDAMIAGGLVRDASEFKSCVFFRQSRECFFRDLNDLLPGRALHIGTHILEDCIIPSICGFDVYRMIFFDNRSLRAFVDDVPGTGTKCSEKGRFAPLEASRRAIDNADVVSFDLFDTLLLRKLACPEDVFAILAYGTDLLKDEETRNRFFLLRCALQSGVLTIEQIYDHIASELPIDDAASIMNKELEIEKSVICAGRELLELAEYAKSQGKMVIVVSDMYLNADRLESLAQNCGINCIDRYYSSCDLELTKKDGLLGLVKSMLEAEHGIGDSGMLRMLHFGDSLEDDMFAARNAGLDFIRVRTLAQNAQADGIGEEYFSIAGAPGKLISRPALASHIVTGLWAEACYNEKSFGRASAASVVLCWMIWLLDQLAGNDLGRVLFAARDGYLPFELYSKLVPKHYPKSVYFYISRHAAFLLSADNAMAAGYIADMSRGMSPEKTLEVFYGVADSSKHSADLMTDDPAMLRMAVIMDNMKDIGASAQASRRAYKEYLAGAGIDNCQCCAYIDLVASGMTQRMLEEVSPFELRGLYLGYPENMIRATENSICYFSDRSEPERRFLKQYMRLEYYMTSFEPSLDGFGDGGTLVFSDEVRSASEMKEIKTVHEEIRRFFDEFSELCGWEQICGESNMINELSALLSPQLAASMYMAGADYAPAERFFDDWSKRWIE